MEFETETRKWGNSLGIILPKSVVKAKGISEKEKVVVEIKKRHTADEFFGIAPEWKKTTEKIKKEIKRGW